MNIRDLKYIIAVADTRHFGRAADRCFVSQPTLSGQIKKLEEALGVTIFERTNRSVEITPVGEAILSHARLLLAQADAIEQVARAHQDPLAGPLRIGAIPTLSPYLMPLILVQLKRLYPQLSLVLSEEVTDALLMRLRRRELDGALIATPVDDPELEQLPLFDEPFWLAYPAGLETFSKERITHQDLEAADLLLLADEHCLTHQVMDVCHRLERPPQGALADLRAASLETLLQLVAAGFGCTLVPALAMRSGSMADAGIVARRLELDDAFRRVSLTYRRSFPRQVALTAFSEVITRHLLQTVRLITPG